MPKIPKIPKAGRPSPRGKPIRTARARPGTKVPTAIKAIGAADTPFPLMGFIAEQYNPSPAARKELLQFIGLDPGLLDLLEPGSDGRRRSERNAPANTEQIAKIQSILDEVGYALGAYPQLVRTLDRSPTPAEYRANFAPISQAAKGLLASLRGLSGLAEVERPRPELQPARMPVEIKAGSPAAANWWKQRDEEWEGYERELEEWEKPGNAAPAKKPKRKGAPEFYEALRQRIPRASESQSIYTVELALDALARAATEIVRDFPEGNSQGSRSRGRTSVNGLRFVIRELRTTFRKHYLGAQLAHDEREFVLVAVHDAGIRLKPRRAAAALAEVRWISDLLQQPLCQPEVRSGENRSLRPR
jgi:hypothetical protein